MPKPRLHRLRLVVAALALGAAACGPIDLGSFPRALEITALDAGDTTGDRISRAIIGRPKTVRVEVTNRTTARQRGVAVTLLFRRGNESVPDAERTIMQRTLMTDLDAGARVTFEFDVLLTQAARLDADWTVSARVDATPARGGPFEAAPALWQTWRVERAPINVTPFVPRRAFALGYPSINAGCPLVLSADISNDGDGSARLDLSLATLPTTSSLRGSFELRGGFPTSSFDPVLPARERGQLEASLTAQTDLAAGTRINVQLEVSARATARPFRSLDVGQARAPGLDLVASGSRLHVVELQRGGGSGGSAPRGSEVEVRATVVFRPGPQGAGSLDDAKLALRVVRPDMMRGDTLLQWPQTADASHSPSLLTACPNPAPDDCGVAREYRVTLQVPATEAPGPVIVQAFVSGTERPGAPRPAIELCGVNERADSLSLMVE